MVRELSASETAARLERDPDDICLLDVREYPELRLAAVERALHIPMGEVPARCAEIDPDKTVIVMCHLGGRSAQVAAYLVSRGYERVFNLTGGIDAWSQSVDSEVPRY